MKSEQQPQEGNLEFLDENSFKNSEVKSQMLICSKGNPSTLLCQNKFCDKNSFICSNSDCSCRLDHLKCLKTFTNELFAEINKKFYSTIQIRKKVDTIIDEAIDYISKIRDDIYLDLKYLGLNQDERQLMETINNKEIQSVKGSMIWKVCQGIYQQKELESNYILKELNKFWNANQKKFKINFEKIKQLAQKQSRSVVKIFQGSQILKRSSDVNNLLGFFPLQIEKAKLIYSARQSKYKMSKFHQLCANMKNSLVIIRSKQGNIFGGFSDIQLSCGANGGPVRYGKSQKAFIFSITNNHKFNITSNMSSFGSAILYNGFEGPTFGANFLGIYRNLIPDLARQNRNGLGNPNFNNLQVQPPNAFGHPGAFGGFGGMQPQPFGFNQANIERGFNQKGKQFTEHFCICSADGAVYQNQKYLSVQSTRQALTGQAQKMFPITEWEVFQLQFQEP